MKKINLLFCLLFSGTLMLAQTGNTGGGNNSNPTNNAGNENDISDDDIDVTVEIDRNTDGSGYTVTAIATSKTEKDDDGKPLRRGSKYGAESGELDETVAHTEAEAKKKLKASILSKRKKEGDGVMAGPDGQGDLRHGTTFPPEILITIGSPAKSSLKIGKETIVINYTNQDQFKRSYRRDIRAAIDKL
jgi:hypothetical protein